MMSAMACGGRREVETARLPPVPVPTVGLAGRKVSVYPLRMLLGERSLGWDTLLTPQDASLLAADSIIGASLTRRAPEVDWVLPEILRNTARRAPGALPNPDRMGTPVLRRAGFDEVPDPLRSQLRLLTAATGDRFAMIPASLMFFRDSTGIGRAELTMVLADVRTGQVSWRTVARGLADSPWDALTLALEGILPVLP